MKGFLANLVLAFAWALLLGGLSLPRLAAGFGLGYLLLGFGERLGAGTGYRRKLPLALRFLGFFLVELLRANLRVAADVLSPRHRSTPGILAIPMRAETPLEVTLLANLITLTPGSMTLDVDLEGRRLYAHVMFLEDPEAARREIQEGLERRLLELLR